MDWKIHYGDGSIFSSDDGRPEDAPALNIQAIAQRDDRVGRFIVTRSDFYLFLDNQWIGVDWFGMLDRLMDIGVIKTGRTITSEAYNDVIQRAKNDPGLPRKSAGHPMEKA